MNQTKLLLAALSAAFAVQAQADTVNITGPSLPIYNVNPNDNSIVIGARARTASTTNDNSVVIGADAYTKSATNSAGGVVIGAYAVADTTAANNGAFNTVAIGRSAQVAAQGGTSVGGNTYTKFDATAVGVLSEAHANRSTAIGTYATVFAQNSTALGFKSSVTEQDLITTATQAAFTRTMVQDDVTGVISVGQSQAAYDKLHNNNPTHNLSNGATSDIYKGVTNRRIINVQDGVNDSDAATVRQVKAAHDQLQTQINAIGTGAAGLDTRIDNLNARLDDVSRDAQDGTALALATAGLVTPPVGKSGFVIGTGHFRGGNAIAMGYAYTGDNWGFKATGSAAGRRNFGGSVSGGIFW